MMEKIYAEMYCSALGSTDVEFYVERGTSDEFIMQKIYDILDLDITYKRVLRWAIVRYSFDRN